MELESFNLKLNELEKEFQTTIASERENFTKRLEELKEKCIDNALKESKKKIQNSETRSMKLDNEINPELYAKFQKKPYLILPTGKKNTLHVYIPKFYPHLQAGWLKDEIDEFYRYEVNQYSIYFGDVPKEILKEIELPEEIPATVQDNEIFFDPKDREKIRKSLPNFLTDWKEKSARITRGHEFDIISKIIESGKIPFKKTPVEKEDILHGPKRIELRDYQNKAWKTFLKTGATGIFHPTGSGKSFLGMKGLETVKVKDYRNLLISPSKSLIEQLIYYIKKFIPEFYKNTLISTYQGFKNFNEKFGLTIYDECQRLPAPGFSKLSVIQTKYRMGLSATPFREDGIGSWIITLTGYPESINWPYYMHKWGPGYHQITVHIVGNNTNSKIRKALELFKENKRTMFYSYGLDVGERISKKLNLPHVHGKTQNRLDVIQNSKSFVASSVFVEGVSIDNLDHIIEVDFHFGSRQEELQLTGRLMHSLSKNKKHDIIMSELEFERYPKRILVLEEKGFHVKLANGNDNYA